MFDEIIFGHLILLTQQYGARPALCQSRDGQLKSDHESSASILQIVCEVN